MTASLKTLLSSIVDYAGLFPPATLNLQEAMLNYAQAQNAADNWMLGHFVLPSERIDEFERLISQFPLQQWSLSLIISQNWQSDLEKLLLLTNPKINIVSLEFPPFSPQKIEKILPCLPTGVNTFFEIAFNEDLNAFLSVLQNPSTSVKIRTGGMTCHKFPAATQLSQVIFSLATAQISFKATAGLHHPLYGEHHLTKDINSLVFKMYGFLNLAVFSALVYWQKITPKEAINILQETSINHFDFKTDKIVWRDYSLSLSEIKEARQQFFHSFGSCSFQEPIEDLKDLKLIN